MRANEGKSAAALHVEVQVAVAIEVADRRSLGVDEAVRERGLVRVADRVGDGEQAGRVAHQDERLLAEEAARAAVRLPAFAVPCVEHHDVRVSVAVEIAHRRHRAGRHRRAHDPRRRDIREAPVAVRVQQEERRLGAGRSSEAPSSRSAWPSPSKSSCARCLLASWGRVSVELARTRGEQEERGRAFACAEDRSRAGVGARRDPLSVAGGPPVGSWRRGCGARRSPGGLSPPLGVRVVATPRTADRDARGGTSRSPCASGEKGLRITSRSVKPRGGAPAGRRAPGATFARIR